MKIGIFTDAHYSSAEITCGVRYNSRSLRKIEEAYKFFEEEKCDLIICLGDVTDTEPTHEKEMENLKEIAEIMRSSQIRTICLMGNHDAFAITNEEFYGILKECEPEDIRYKDKTLLFLDACYFANGNHYKPGDTDWTDTFYPQTAALQEKLRSCTGPVYIFMHQNIDPNIQEDHRVGNADEICRILQESRHVKAVFQGHYHPGKESVHQEIRYVTFPAVCEREKAYFIEQI